MSRKADRVRSLEVRRNPSLAFVSVDSLLEAYRLIEGDHKLEQALQSVDSWLSPRSCLTFLQLFAQAFKRRHKESEPAFGFMTRAMEDWCQDGDKAVRFFGTMLEGACLDSPPAASTCASTYLAVWMAKHHNPAMYTSGGGILPPTRMLTLAYQATSNGNEQATTVLSDYWQIMDHHGNIPTNKPTSVGTRTPWYPPASGVAKLFAGSLLAYIHQQDKESGLDEVERVLVQKEKAIDLLIESLWEGVTKNSRRDVKSSGEDVFHLQGPLDRLGWGYRYFVRNEHNFPAVGVATLANFQCSRLWLMSELNPGDRSANQGSICKLSHLGALLAYHKIACGEPAEQGSGKSRHSDAVEQVVGVPYDVRPHDRILREGWKAGDNARLEYKKRFGRDLPNGKTFVREHERSRRSSFRRLRNLPSDVSKPVVSINIARVLDEL